MKMSANKVRSNQILCLLQLCTESLLSTYTVEINSKKFRVDRDKSDFFQVSDHCEDHKHHPYILSTVYIYDYFISSHSIILWLSVSSKYKKKITKKLEIIAFLSSSKMTLKELFYSVVMAAVAKEEGWVG